jgi:hypothetical protein
LLAANDALGSADLAQERLAADRAAPLLDGEARIHRHQDRLLGEQLREQDIHLGEAAAVMIAGIDDQGLGALVGVEEALQLRDRGLIAGESPKIDVGYALGKPARPADCAARRRTAHHALALLSDWPHRAKLQVPVLVDRLEIGGNRVGKRETVGKIGVSAGRQLRSEPGRICLADIGKHEVFFKRGGKREHRLERFGLDERHLRALVAGAGHGGLRRLGEQRRGQGGRRQDQQWNTHHQYSTV